jgi:excisionase family DNA binding protein
MAEAYLTPEEAAVTEVKPITIRLWIAAGALRAAKVGRLWRSRRSDLDAMLAGEVTSCQGRAPKR